MVTSPLNMMIQHLMADVGPEGGGLTDGELLARFLRSREDAALAALVRRHAQMVWGVCCRLLHNRHDAEDAFQATFLVLVRRAADVPRQAVANWLYGVARQTAVRSRATAAKRGRREKQVVTMPEAGIRGQGSGIRSQESRVRDPEWSDLQLVLDDELGRLPDKYRSVIVLCDLEGMTRKEAARHLGIPEGSVASRLARARVMLGKRLTRRGVVLSGGSVATVLSAGSASASVPPALVVATIKAASLLAAGQAAGVVSAKVAALTQGVVHAMFATKIKSTLAIMVVAAVLAGAMGLIYQSQAAEWPETKAGPSAARNARNMSAEEQIRADPHAQQKLPPPKTDEERIAGWWTIVNDDSKRKGEVWEIGKHQIVMNANQTGIRVVNHFHRLDSAKNPRQIDITVTSPNNVYGGEVPIDPNKNRPVGVIKGIYELDRGELRLCLGEMGKDRPVAFPEKPGPGQVLVLHRVSSTQPQEAKDQTLNLEEPVHFVRWSRDGMVMASLSKRATEVDGKKASLSTFRLWDGKTGKLKLNLGEVEYPGFGTFDLSPDGKILAISSRLGVQLGDKVELYDVENGTLLTSIEMEYGRSRPWFAFSPDSRTLAVCGFEFKEAKAVGTVRLFDTKKGELTRKLFSHGGQVISVTFAHDGKSLAAGCAEGEITLWDATTGKVKMKLDAAGSIPALAWSTDGKLLASGGSQGGRVWDLATGTSHALKAPEGSGINELAFSPDGRYVAGDGGLVKKDDQWRTTILVWDAATGELLHEWLGARGFAFMPDSRRLAIMHDPKTVKLIAIAQGELISNSQADALVRQLGDKSFSKRQAAEKALTNMGATAAESVRTGTRVADPEIARRCADIWPRLWQTEIALPDAERLAGYAHPLWARFRQVAGDDASSSKLFAEVAADLRRFEKLEAVDANPAKAADAYAAELKERVEALNKGWLEAEAAAGLRTGLIVPRSGYPTQAEFATLLFLGTFPSTAPVTFKGTGHHDSASHSMVFAMGQAQSPAMRRLVAAWLDTRTNQAAIQLGLSQVVRNPIAEILPAARKHAASAELESGTRALALLVIGRLGGTEDYPLLLRAFADTRVWYTTKWSSGTGNERPIEVQVGDTALGCALWIYGQRAADFGFPIAEMLRNHPDTLAQYGLLGFFDNATRQAAHKKAEEWLDQHKNDKATRYRVKDWQVLFGGKTIEHWRTEGQVTVEDGLLKVGGDQGGSIVTTASFGRGSLAFAYRQAGDAKTVLTWRGEKHPLSPARQGWTSEGYDPDAKGESPIHIIAPPGTTLWLREFAFRPY